jgi:8-amino-3,8-dideoxy-alpha-D-manno-octulosonate transaminase
VVSLDFGKIITCGEGGLVLTNRHDVFAEARGLHDHGHDYEPSVPRGRDTRHRWGFNFRMTELQAAVALAQLRKLDAIIEAQLRRKVALKEALRSEGLPISFRDLPDPGGDNGDTLFFYCDDAHVAARVAEALAGAGVGTKNIPDALDWHFAGQWTHMLEPFYDQPIDEVFRRSGDLLRRTVAVPIWATSDPGWIERVTDTVVSCFRRG